MELNRDEARCIKRNDIVEALADALPERTIRFGSQIVSIEKDETTSFPVVYLSNIGNTIKSKVKYNNFTLQENLFLYILNINQILFSDKKKKKIKFCVFHKIMQTKISNGMKNLPFAFDVYNCN